MVPVLNDILLYLVFGLLLTLVGVGIFLGIAILRLLTLTKLLLHQDIQRQAIGKEVSLNAFAGAAHPGDGFSSLASSTGSRDANKESRACGCVGMQMECETNFDNQPGNAQSELPTYSQQLPKETQTLASKNKTFSDKQCLLESSSVSINNTAKTAFLPSQNTEKSGSSETIDEEKFYGGSFETNEKNCDLHHDTSSVMNKNPYEFAEDVAPKQNPYSFALDTVLASGLSQSDDNINNSSSNLQKSVENTNQQNQQSPYSGKTSTDGTQQHSIATEAVAVLRRNQNTHNSTQSSVASNKLILRKQETCSRPKSNNRLSRVQVSFSRRAGDLHFFGRCSGYSEDFEESDDETLKVNDEEESEIDDEEEEEDLKFNNETFLASARNDLKNQLNESKALKLDLLPPPLPPISVRLPLEEYHKKQRNLEIASGYLAMKGHAANDAIDELQNNNLRRNVSGKRATHRQTHERWNLKKKAHRRSVSCSSFNIRSYESSPKHTKVANATLNVPTICLEIDPNGLRGSTQDEELNASCHDKKLSSTEQTENYNSDVEAVWQPYSANSEYVEMHWQKKVKNDDEIL